MKFLANIFRNLSVNWRDIFCAVIAMLLFSFLADVVVRWSADDDGATWMVNLVAMLQGFVRFAGANLCLWLLGMAVAYPTVNAWSHTRFDEVFRTLEPKEKFHALLVLIGIQGIMAAICFSN